MKRAVVVPAILGAILFAAACETRSDHSCAKDPKMGCVCQSEPYRLRAGEQPVKECGPPPPNLLSYRCCHDLDSDGRSTQCTCESAVCVTATASFCTCGMQARPGEVGNVVASCEADAVKGIRCCKKGSRCTCSSSDCTEGAVVDRCTANDVTVGACGAPASHEAKTCDSLKWKKKG